MYTPLRIDPTRALADINTFQRKLAAGMGHLRNMREPD
jgi:polyhydroxyalkanoate synthase